MTGIIPEGFPSLYQDGWSLELQQLTSRLSAYVNVDPIHGKSKRYNRLGKVVARQITGRFGDTNPDDVDTEYRWLHVGFKDSAHIIDRREAKQLGTVGSPHVQIQRSQLAAAARDMDATLINGIIGNAAVGENGETPTPLPAGQQIAVNFVDSGNPANSGMTFAKLLEVATRFGLAQVFGQDVENSSQGCVALTHRQIKDLLREEKLTSSDYGIQRLQSGEVVNVFGLAIKAVSPEILPFNAATDVRTCVAWAREHVVFGVAENPEAFADVLPGKRHDVQLRTEWGWGALRIADEGVITIACDESPTA